MCLPSFVLLLFMVYCFHIHVNGDIGVVNVHQQIEDEAAPIITSISPVSCLVNQSVQVKINGQNLGGTGGLISVTLNGIPCENPTIANSIITCQTGITSVSGSGPVIVNTTANGASDPNTPIHFGYYFPPTITGCDPDNGPQSGDQIVTITGSNFGDNATELISVSLAHIPCKEFTHITSNKIQCLSGSSEAAGRGTIEVETKFGGLSTSTIDYTYNLAPYISSIEPTNGPQEGGIAVTIRGNNLAKSREDIENVTLGGVVCRFPRLVNGNNGVLTCQSSSSLTPTSGLVVVQSYSGGVSEGDIHFTFNPPPKTISISPTNGKEDGGTKLSIYGENFGQEESDITEVTVGGASCFSSLVYHNSTFLSCLTPQKPEEIKNNGNVIIITKSGGTGISVQSTNYTYNPRPVISKISPSTGSIQGFTIVQIFGENLGQSISDIRDVIIAGNSCLFSLTYISSSHLTCATSTSPNPRTGQIVIETISSGFSLVSSSTPNFTYSPVCHGYSSLEECNTYGCFWCSTTSVCLGDEISCPINCSMGNLSCGEVAIVSLISLILLTIVVGIGVIVHFVNRDNELKKTLQRFGARKGFQSNSSINIEDDE